MVGSRRRRIQIRVAVFWSALLVAIAFGPACAKRSYLKQRVTAPVDAWGIAVYPVIFRIPVSPFHSFDRGRQIAERVSATTGRLVYGPGEFRLDDPDQDDPARGTNLAAALKYSKQRRPEGVVALRVIVGTRVSLGEAQGFDPGGKARRKRVEERVEVAVHAELLSMATHRVISEAEDVAMVDPFSEALDTDPYPDVTRLTKVLVDELVGDAKLARATPGPELGLKVVTVPGPALAYTVGSEPSLKDELSKLDALEGDARLMGLLQAVDPEAPRSRLRALKNSPHGLVVVAAEGRAKAAGLEPDDVLLQADGERITGRHVLDRHLAAGRTSLVVKRSGQEREVTIDPAQP